jgi:hypothetical protein
MACAAVVFFSLGVAGVGDLTAGITWRLNSGVPAPDVAKWAGHSVEVLTRVYAGCVAGLDEVWIARMNAGLHPGGSREAAEDEPAEPADEGKDEN